MSASRTRTTQTAFGEVRYETVECASCGIEVRKEDARRFVVGEVRDRDEWHSIGEDRFTFQSGTVQTGWACEFCREQGVAGFPDSKVWDVLNQYPMVFFSASTALVALMMVVFELLMITT